MSPRQQENLKNELRYLAGRWPVLAHDGVMATFAWFMAYWFRFNLDTIPEPFYGHAVKFLPLVIVVHLGMFGLFGVPRGRMAIYLGARPGGDRESRLLWHCCDSRRDFSGHQA